MWKYFITQLFLFSTLTACNSTQTRLAQDRDGSRTESINLSEESVLLDVGIIPFTYREGGSEHDDYSQLRQAEGIYQAYLLQKLMESSEEFGTVSLLPDDEIKLDLLVNGMIVYSDGEILELNMEVTDSSGAYWFRNSYRHVVTTNDYETGQSDPFGTIYKQIARDIRQYVSDLHFDELQKIRSISKLRFASWFLPETYSSHLSRNRNGVYSLNHLPALSDPYSEKLDQIHLRHGMYLKTQLEDYRDYADNFVGPYTEWRKNILARKMDYLAATQSSRQHFVQGIKQTLWGLNPLTLFQSISSNREHTGTGAAIQSFEQAMAMKYETDMHRETLKELNQSIDTLVQTRNVAIDDRVVTLQGNIAARYNRFRELLREIYLLEVH